MGLFKVGTLVKITSAPEDLILGVVMPEDPDTLWIHPNWVNVFIFEGEFKGETFQLEKEQLELMSGAA